MKKIGFCFLIYDEINHEDLWKRFFDNADTKKYNIYIHYKFDKPLKYFERHKLKHCVETEYTKPSIVHAHNLLLETALENDCSKMITLSQSCVPLKTFDHVYQFLTKDDYAHFNIAPQDTCFPRCNNLLKHYDKNKIQKSSEWYILNRRICEAVTNIDNKTIDYIYDGTSHSVEHYFITTVYNNNLQNQIISTPNLAAGATTFTNWPDMEYKFPSVPSPTGPMQYDYISDEELMYLINSKSLFGRKFNKGCDIDIISCIFH